MSEASGAQQRLLIGVLVGGSATRMGGVAKGLLLAPGSPSSVLERLLGEARAALPGCALVLVGSNPAYASFGLPQLSDRPAGAGVGPIGGLRALLAHARELGLEQALLLACDLPKLERGLLARLASELPHASALVTSQAGKRNPMVARYAVAPAQLALEQVTLAGSRSLQAVLDRLIPAASLLALSASEQAQLDDWDTPSDVARDR